jgi:hypothetical protein
MVIRTKNDRVVEYGDFQTPLPLARRVCRLLSQQGVSPRAIVEPTCGIGSFVLAAMDEFVQAEHVLGLDINPAYLDNLQTALRGRADAERARTIEGSFFTTNWPQLLADLPDPLLVIGNPPWVTNAQLGVLGSPNLPKKTNFKHHSGLEALTGKSNFDISEWMLLQFLDWLDGRDAVMAVLCKTAVARKVLLHAWRQSIRLSHSALHRIDADASFSASVDACLLTCKFSSATAEPLAYVYEDLAQAHPSHTLGYRDRLLLADVNAYDRWKHLQGEEGYRWRSGVKHDCARVIELVREGDRYRNGLGELVDLEPEFVFPMLKGSEIANGQTLQPRRWMLVTQRHTGDDTSRIRDTAPKTWEYLQSHAELLHRRASSIYRKRPPFSVFGVGEYAFASWKVAISALHKTLVFRAIGSCCCKPIVLDDTCCFLPCAVEDEAKALVELLHSQPAREFFSAFLFWDAKRPITIEVLRQLNLVALARALGLEKAIPHVGARKRELAHGMKASRNLQLALFGGQ